MSKDIVTNIVMDRLQFEKAVDDLISAITFEDTDKKQPILDQKYIQNAHKSVVDNNIDNNIDNETDIYIPDV